MPQKFEYDVFLSYSSKDKKTVHALAKRLKRDGLKVWLDEWEVKPGAMIGLKIQQGIEQSRTLVMCMSPAYFGSGWATLEHYSLLFRDPTNVELRFIPLLIETCSPPDVIAQFAHIDWRDRKNESYAKLLSACRESTEIEPQPEVRAAEPGGAPSVLEGHKKGVLAVAVTPDGKRAISGAIDRTLKIWDLDRGTCTSTLKGHDDRIWAVAVTPDGKRAVSGANDDTVKLWDLDSGACTHTLKGHANMVLAVAVTPDGKRAVSGSYDKTLKLWNLDSGQCIGTFEGHSKVVRGIAITPDGGRIVSASDDRALRVWATGPGHRRGIGRETDFHECEGCFGG